MRSAWPPIAAVLFLSGCSFDVRVPTGRLVTCVTTVDCQPGQACQQGTHSCVPEALLDDVPPTVLRSTLQLVPRAENPLDAPLALGPLTNAHVLLTVDEPLAVPPSFDISPVDAAFVTCDALLSTPTTVDATCTVASVSAPVTTRLTLSAQLTDLARNEARVTLPFSIELDTQAPAGPPQDGGLVLRESPWGDGQTAGKPSTRVLPGRAPLDDTARLEFRKGSVTLGSAQVNDGGFLPVELLRSDDSVALEVSAIDRAGNRSAWSAVLWEEWLASFHGKRAGETFPNPHRFQAMSALAQGLEGFPVLERGDTDVATALPKPNPVVGAATWQHFNPGTVPDGTGVLGLLELDPLRSRLLAFGGHGRSANYDLSARTWEWSGHDWIERHPADPESDGDPEGRLAAASTWDPVRKAIIMAGGVALTTLSDVWAWNGASWRRLADLPVKRFGGLLYFDASTRRLVFTGGTDATNPTTALPGAWALENDSWVEVAEPAVHARIGPSTVTLPSGQNALLSGDVGVSMTLWYQSGDTWSVYDAGPTLPPSRGGAALAWDSKRDVLVMHGGEVANQTAVDEVWELGDAGWKRITPSTVGSPGAMSYHHMAFDPSLGWVLLHSALDGGFAATWAWDGTRWRIIARAAAAPDRLLASELVYDFDAGTLRTLAETGGVPQNAWLRNTGWVTRDDPSLPTVNPRLAALDSTLWLATSDGGAVSLWYGTGDSWSNLVPDIGVRAPSLFGLTAPTSGLDALACCVGTPDGGPTLVVARLAAGGNLTPVQPRMTLGSSAAVGNWTAVLGREERDAVSHLVLVGPGAPDASWPLPSGLISSAFSALRERSSLVVPGGVVLSGPNSELLEFTLTRGWQSLPVADPEGDGNPLMGLSIALGQTETGSLVAVDRDQPGAGVWRLSVAPERPGVMLRFALGALPADAVILSGTLTLRVGATGGAPLQTRGALGYRRDLGQWSGGQWLTDAGIDQPAQVVVSLDDDALETIRRRTDELDFLVTSAGANEHGFAQLVVDDVRLSLQLKRAAAR